MPRPTMTMVFQRPSRSSRSSTSSALMSPTGSADAAQESASDVKRVRKPSQKMLEALQNQDEPQEPSSDASSSKSKRMTSPGSSNAKPPTPKVRKSDKMPDNEQSGSNDEGRGSPLKNSGKKISLATEISNAPTEKEPEVLSRRSTRGKRIKTKADKNITDDETALECSSPDDPVEEQEQSKVLKKVPRLKISLKKDLGADVSTPSEPVSRITSPIVPTELPELISAPKIRLKIKSTKKQPKKAQKEVKEVIVETVQNDEDLDSNSINEQYPSIPIDTPVCSSAVDKRLTARQRAKLYGAEDHLIRLEDPLPKTPPPDHQEKREERNKKRREQAAQRREDLKTETVHKLLHKPTNSRKGAKGEGPLARKAVRYQIDQSGVKIFYPEDVGSMQPMLPIAPPKRILCGIKGCERLKKYSCRKTGVPLCSLECYKKNILSSCK